MRISSINKKTALKNADFDCRLPLYELAKSDQALKKYTFTVFRIKLDYRVVLGDSFAYRTVRQYK